MEVGFSVGISRFLLKRTRRRPIQRGPQGQLISGSTDPHPLLCSRLKDSRARDEAADWWMIGDDGARADLLPRSAHREQPPAGSAKSSLQGARKHFSRNCPLWLGSGDIEIRRNISPKLPAGHRRGVGGGQAGRSAYEGGAPGPSTRNICPLEKTNPKRPNVRDKFLSAERRFRHPGRIIVAASRDVGGLGARKYGPSCVSPALADLTESPRELFPGTIGLRKKSSKGVKAFGSRTC